MPRKADSKQVIVPSTDSFVESFFSLWGIMFEDQDDVIDTFLQLPLPVVFAGRLVRHPEVESWTVSEALYAFPDFGEFFCSAKLYLLEILQKLFVEYDTRKTYLRNCEIKSPAGLREYSKVVSEILRNLQKELPTME